MDSKQQLEQQPERDLPISTLGPEADGPEDTVGRLIETMKNVDASEVPELAEEIADLLSEGLTPGPAEEERGDEGP